MLFINTRPVERAEPLTKGIKHFGIEVIELPLLALKPIDLSLVLSEQFEIMSTQAQVVVVVSPTAANIGLKYLEQLGYEFNDLNKLHWIAVGDKTAEVFHQIGLQVHVPDVETSEGMLALPILKELDINCIAFWRGEGGRQFMMDHLAQKNIHILNMILYERGLPQSTVTSSQHVAEILKQYHEKIYVCISSEASWHYWLNLFSKDINILYKCHYLVLGARVYTIVAKSIALPNISLISSLKADELGRLMMYPQQEK